ncbi:amino acid adenylation domain-containing protein [Streptomyces sp. CA-179760]|uniref:amino acid adenylation domain-containing protein n=1 Tax=Streptomyces sp. CA-179760 TaxID=3240054 RepID=UPI003D8EECCB
MTETLLREHARFWQEVLAAGPTRAFPVRPADDQPHELRQMLPEGLPAAATGRPHGLHLLVCGALVALLHRYTHAESVVIGQGAPIGGGVDGTGPDHLIPLRCAVFGTDTFTEVVNRIRTAVFDSYAHQNFDIGVLGQTVPYQVAIRVEGLHTEPAPHPVPLLLDIAATGELTLRATGIGEDIAARLLRHLTTLLEQVLADPGLVLTEVDLLTEADMRLLERSNDTARPAGPHRTVPAMFAHAVAAHPDAPALLSPDGALTYRELDERTDSLAAAILEQGAERVAVVAERSPGLVIAVLAVLKAGAAYVPVDPSLPAERIDFVLRDSGASMVLRGDTEVPDRPLPAVTVRPEDQAYVIYTSGSTGEPKGVVVEHRSLLNLLAGTQRAYPLGPGDVILHKTSISFDVSVWELFGWLPGGGALALLPPGAEGDPDAIIDAVERYEVTVLDLVPQLLGALGDVVVARNAAGRMRTLRLVSTGSDELAADHVHRFRKAFPRTRLVNFYGPTEATVQVTHFPVGDDADERVPIGGPLDNTRLYVMDRLLRPQAVGAPGELCVAGDSLARGYLNRPGRTRESFVPAPSVGEARVYRTGDLCRRLDDGTLEFLGRIDQQIKVRGHRVEPGEIEHRLRSCPGVEDAVVVATGRSADDRRLVAYVTGTTAADPDDVLRRLREVLPAYMVPAAVHRLATFPVTVSGKVDRARLAAGPQRESGGVRP